MKVKLGRARDDLNKALANQVGGWRVYLDRLKAPKPLRRSQRTTKAALINERLEKLMSYLNMTDDSSHGIEIAAIENKGRGIQARTKVS